MALRCTVCDHPQREAIDSLILHGAASERIMANQFTLTQAAIHRHKKHVSQRLAKAAERKGLKSEDLFMERHEHLYRETLQYVEDAKLAVKMQRTTVEVPDGDPDLGRMKLQERYQAFRDVGAMAPALQTAVQLQRILGDATGKFASAAQPAAGAPHITIVMPRSLDLPHGQVVDIPAIQAPDPTDES